MPAAFFDIVGTCMSYTAAEEALDLKFGKTLAKYGLNGKSLFHLWIATHERDSAYMSTTKRPRITGVAGGTWRLTLPRVLYQAGIPPSLVDDMCDEETVDYLIQHYNDCLVPYAGLQEMIETLEAGGIEFWACSGASVARVKNYFDRSGIPMPLERIWDVTPVGTHKPHLEVYEYLMKERKAKDPAEVLIFGASHAWDVAGAKESGWQTAYCTEYEHYECVPQWGKHDVVAATLPELGRAMVAKWGSKS